MESLGHKSLDIGLEHYSLILLPARCELALSTCHNGWSHQSCCTYPATKDWLVLKLWAKSNFSLELIWLDITGEKQPIVYEAPWAHTTDVFLRQTQFPLSVGLYFEMPGGGSGWSRTTYPCYGGYAVSRLPFRMGFELSQKLTAVAFTSIGSPGRPGAGSQQG